MSLGTASFFSRAADEAGSGAADVREKNAAAVARIAGLVTFIVGGLVARGECDE